jgi:hypothetical protein
MDLSAFRKIAIRVELLPIIYRYTGKSSLVKMEKMVKRKINGQPLLKKKFQFFYKKERRNKNNKNCLGSF